MTVFTGSTLKKDKSMKKTNTFLDKILANKILEVESLKKFRPLTSLQNALLERKTEIRDFARAVSQPGRVSLIAEIKKASPSSGLIRKDFNHMLIAKEYEKSGLVDAISVLTDRKYFQGDIKFIRDIKAVTSVPVLRKDFIFDECQVYESYLAEADAILLIAAMLETKLLKSLINLAHKLGMNCLVEAHTKEEIEMSVNAGVKIIGINCRDLKTFKVKADLFKKLVKYIPQNIIKVAESGLTNNKDIRAVYEAHANAVLVGSSIMSSKNIQEKLKELLRLENIEI